MHQVLCFPKCDFERAVVSLLRVGEVEWSRLRCAARQGHLPSVGCRNASRLRCAARASGPSVLRLEVQERLESQVPPPQTRRATAAWSSARVHARWTLARRRGVIHTCGVTGGGYSLAASQSLGCAQAGCPWSGWAGCPWSGCPRVGRGPAKCDMMWATMFRCPTSGGKTQQKRKQQRRLHRKHAEKKRDR